MYKCLIAISILLSIMSCNGHKDCRVDGVADSMALSFSWGLPVTLAETSKSGPPSGFDPFVESYYTTATNTTHIYAADGYSGSAYNEAITITITGRSSGEYSVNNGEATVQYTNTSQGRTFTASSGKVLIVTYDGAGCYVTGSFLVSDNGSNEISGDFITTREANQ